MTVANTVVSQTYNGDDVTTSFSIPFDFTSEDVIKVYLDNVLQALTTKYSLTGGPPVTTVEMITPPATGEKLKIIRISPRTQDSSFSGTTFPAASVEERLDENIRLIQEIDNDNGTKISLSLGSPLLNLRLPLEVKNKFLKWNDDATAIENTEAIPAWVTAESYTTNNLVIEANVIYACVTGHTAGVFADDLGAGLWIGISGSRGVKGDTGDQGIKGDTGAKGDKGDSGANGSAGSDGIFSEIASQAEAQAGVDNTKGMTPLRTKEAIASQIPNYSTTISDLQAADAALVVADSALSDRISTLETNQTSSQYSGSQRLLNNESTPQEILGVNGLAGKGTGFTVDADGTKHARFECQVYRKDDAEERFVTVIILLHYIGTTWHLGVESRTVLIGNYSGLTFDLVQVGNAATVRYVSDDMSGGNYSEDSRITYKGTEIAIGV